MTAVDNAVSQEELEAKAWAGFTEGNWQKDIDVRDFSQARGRAGERHVPTLVLHEQRCLQRTC